MIDRQASQASRLHTYLPLAVALLSTLAIMWWATATRRVDVLPTFTTAMLIDIQFELWDVISGLTGLAIPLLLFYLLSVSEPLGRRLSAGPAASPPSRQVWAAFLLFHLLALIWLGLQQSWPVSLVLFPVVLGGLFGGWQMGVALGALAALLPMLLDLTGGYGLELLEASAAIVREDGIGSLPDQLWADFQWLYLGSDRVIFIWAGLIAGLVALQFPSHRTRPAIGFAAGAIISYLALIIPTFGYETPELLSPDSLGIALAIGIAIALALLILRGAQAATAQREAELAKTARIEAELLALRSQINPHFFFNSLNTIRYLVRVDPTAARGLLLDLSTIFQRVLRAGDFVPLRQELEHVQAYLNLEKARLEERLQVEIDAPDVELLDVPVPTLTLQPLVENAVVHGLSPRRQGGTVTISALRQGEELVVSIRDDGAGMDAARLAQVMSADNHATSIGLRNVDTRLRALYGEAYGLQVSSAPDAGTTVRLHLPLNGKG